MLIQFLIKNLLILHSGNAGEKAYAAIKLTALPAAGISISQRITGWYIESQFFMFIMVFCLFGDLAIGIIKHLKLRTFSFSKMFIGFTKKLVLIVVFYFFSEALLQIISDGDMDSVWIKIFLKLLVFAWPAGNSAVNMGIITNGEFPFPFLLKRIKKFNESGDLSLFNFKPKKDESENTNTDSPE